MKDTTETLNSEARDPGDREHVNGLPGLTRSEVACSSNTQLPTRQSEMESAEKAEQSRYGSLTGTTGIDWWQLAACVRWNPVVSGPFFEMFNECKLRAQKRFAPVALEIGEDLVSVDRKGSGRGKDSHKEIQLLWNGVVVGLSERLQVSRQLSNASLLVSGAPCLINGWGTSWEFFHRLIETIGGTIEDEWIKRVDLCIDYPELHLNDSLGTALRNHQFVATNSKASLHQDPDGLQGFSLGKCNRVRVVIYDKLLDVMCNHDSVYRSAMIQKRWGGSVPSCATRLEFQIGRPWLKMYELTRSNAITRIGDIYEKLTSGSRSVFRITADLVDRDNRHQDRAKTHPIWERMVEIGRDTVGGATEKLVPIDRSSLDEKRAVKQIVGFGTSLADRRQRLCVNRQDLFEVIDEAFDQNEIDDDYIRRKFEAKAKLSGTMQELFQFPPKETA